MNAKPWDGAGQARRALQGIVRDPQYGVAALSQPAVMSNLLKDFLPDEPREAGLLVAAAQADLAGALRGYLAQGLDPATAVSLTASSFVGNSSHTQEAGTWVVTELALALGLDPYRTAQAAAPPPAPFAQPTAVAAPVSQVTPPYAAASPVQPGYGAAGSPWQQPTAAVPPKSSSRGSIPSAIIGLGGALFLLIACFVPLHTNIPGATSNFGVFFGHEGFSVGGNFWFAAVPLVTLLVAIAAAIALLVPGDRPRGRAMFQGMLIALGIQTVVVFAFYGDGVFTGTPTGAGVPLGIIGGLAFLLGGIVGMAAGRTGSAPAGPAGGYGTGPANPAGPAG